MGTHGLFRDRMKIGFKVFVLFAVPLAAVLLAGCPLPPIPPTPQPPTPSLNAGVVIVVESVTIPEDLRPEVIFRLEDNRGNAFALSELTDARFILAAMTYREDGTRDRLDNYTVSASGGYTTATFDGARLNGITDNGDGTFTYKFATVLPADYQRGVTHQLAGQFRRGYPVDGQSYYYNLSYRFVPDGSVVMDTREIVSTETCNGCHTRLELHGGSRREIQLCIVCHNRQSYDADTGNSVDMATMIHKIHMGAELPSVQAGEPYRIIGFGGSVHDYSEVEFPQDIRNCQVCHQNAPQSDAFLLEPTLAGCAACHDRVWFGDPGDLPEGYEEHVGGQQIDDQLCSLCHTATRPGAAPIDEAHVVPTESEDAPGLNLTINSVETTAVEGGTQVRVVFTAVDGQGAPINDLSVLSSVSMTAAWPASDYQTTLREAVAANPTGTRESLGNGQYAYTYAALFPAESSDTFAVAMEGRRTFTFRGASVTQGTESNSITFFTLDGSDPEPRREVVDEAACTVCHSEIRAHGAQRVGVSLCVMCHNPMGTDAARRPADQMPPVTVNFKDMIHRIHTGEELESDYTVYGFGNVAHDFTGILFPGDRSQCTICHLDGTMNLPLGDTAMPTTVKQSGEVISEVLPTRAACTSCHDGIMPNVHAILGTDAETGIETCAICHGEDAAFAVEEVHRLTP